MSRALIDRIVEARVRRLMSKPGASGSYEDFKIRAIAEINALSNMELLDVISIHIRER